jgi:hypothetical protein
VGGPETVRVVGVHGRSPFVGVLARAIIRTNVTLNVTLVEVLETFVSDQPG